MSQLLSGIINILFPQHCMQCNTGDVLLCERCLKILPRAKQHERAFIMSLYDYRNLAVRKIIWRLKYKNVRGVAKIFGKNLYNEIVTRLCEHSDTRSNKKFLLVPIPLHQMRFRERGYNQSELLCRAIMDCATHELFHFETRALTRVRKTKAQVRSEKRAARFENLRDAFLANPALVEHKNIILIDDVTTTGATLIEARKALLKAGARSVRAYTVAH